MKTLIMDTSSNWLLIYFIEDNKILFNVQSVGNNNHSDHLINEITNGLNKLNWQIKDFNNIIIGVGPGAYTGLRVSMTVAKMFAWTLKIPLYTVSSLDLLTSGYYNQDGLYGVMLKAKKNYSYTKIFSIENGKYKQIEYEMFLLDTEFKNKIASYQNIKLIQNDNILINPLLLTKLHVNKVDNIHILEPNYLRGAI